MLVHRRAPRLLPFRHPRPRLLVHFIRARPRLKLLSAKETALDNGAEFKSGSFEGRFTEVGGKGCGQSGRVFLSEAGELKELLTTEGKRAAETGFESLIKSCMVLFNCRLVK